MENSILNFGYEAVAILAPILCMLVIGLLSKKFGLENLIKLQNVYESHQAEIALIKQLAVISVRAIEQKYGGIKFGAEKLALAMKDLSEALEKIGIQISAKELDKFVHDALKELKDEFGEQWDKKVKEKE
jgi:hypothetical protein